MRIRNAILMLLIGVLAPTLVASAAAAETVLCRKRSKLKIRDDQCRVDKGEEQVTLAGLGIVPGTPGRDGQDGLPGAPGQNGQDGEDGTALAYAQVRAADDGLLLIDAMTRNIVSVTSPTVGVYCVIPADGIDRNAHPAVASVQHSLGNPARVDTTVRLRFPFVCQDNSAYEVLTIRVDPTSNVGGALVDDVGFNIIVP